MEAKQDIPQEQDRADGNRAVMASALSSGHEASWLDEDDDEPYDPRCVDCMCSVDAGKSFCASCLMFGHRGF
jgi:hypothetical protein